MEDVIRDGKEANRNKEAGIAVTFFYPRTLLIIESTSIIIANPATKTISDISNLTNKDTIIRTRKTLKSVSLNLVSVRVDNEEIKRRNRIANDLVTNL